MARSIKNGLYFRIAAYFRFFASIRLARWKPRIVVITGSNGKTTALHLLKTHLGSAARYSFGANSSFGIPFDILDLKRESFSPLEWLPLFFLAPLRALKKPPAERIYAVEADCDRPREGDFLSSLLKPEVAVWLSCARTHSRNFDELVASGAFSRVDDAIAREFGCFLERASKLAVVNGDEPLIARELARTNADVRKITRSSLQSYKVGAGGTEFEFENRAYRFPHLLPRETFYAIAAAIVAANYFGREPRDFSALAMPPGRSSLFKGVKNTTILDSTYNANAASVAAILDMARAIPIPEKWLILGDLTEQGAEEKEEHEKLARMLPECGFSRIVFVGPRLRAHALPILKAMKVDAASFVNPKDALDYLHAEIGGNELLVFKGARFLEGVVEHLLADERDAEKLCRREAIWRKRRAGWGL